MSSEELKEAIVEIYEKILEKQSQLQNREKYFEELTVLNKKYNMDYSRENEIVKESEAKYEILDSALNDIHNILTDYNTDIESLKEELDN